MWFTDDWRTKDELDYLDGLGSHLKERFEPMRVPLSRRRLLELYLETAKSRVEWGAIDAMTCISHATTLLALEPHKPA
jgi:hypothetical protein